MTREHRQSADLAMLSSAVRWGDDRVVRALLPLAEGPGTSPMFLLNTLLPCAGVPGVGAILGRAAAVIGKHEATRLLGQNPELPPEVITGIAGRWGKSSGITEMLARRADLPAPVATHLTRSRNAAVTRSLAYNDRIPPAASWKVLKLAGMLAPGVRYTPAHGASVAAAALRTAVENAGEDRVRAGALGGWTLGTVVREALRLLDGGEVGEARTPLLAAAAAGILPLKSVTAWLRRGVRSEGAEVALEVCSALASREPTVWREARFAIAPARDACTEWRPWPDRASLQAALDHPHPEIRSLAIAHPAAVDAGVALFDAGLLSDSEIAALGSNPGLSGEDAERLLRVGACPAWRLLGCAALSEEARHEIVAGEQATSVAAVLAEAYAATRVPSWAREWAEPTLLTTALRHAAAERDAAVLTEEILRRWPELTDVVLAAAPLERRVSTTAVYHVAERLIAQSCDPGRRSELAQRIATPGSTVGGILD